MTRAKLAGVLGFAAVMGCVTVLEGGAWDEPPADLSDTERVTMLVQLANPSMVALFGQEPFSPYGVDVQTSVCPASSLDGDAWVLTGGCVDDAGHRWTGQARIYDFEDETEDGTYVYEGFGRNGFDAFSLSGVATYETSHGVRRFSADLTREALGESEQRTFSLVYEGSSWMEGEVSVLEGSGVVAIFGVGQVQAVTSDQRFSSDLCSDEAVSGETVVYADGREVVITYDGAEDCDAASTVQWSLDGVPQGELEGVSCSHVGLGAWLWLWVPVLALRRQK